MKVLALDSLQLFEPFAFEGLSRKDELGGEVLVGDFGSAALGDFKIVLLGVMVCLCFPKNPEMPWVSIGFGSGSALEFSLLATGGLLLCFFDKKVGVELGDGILCKFNSLLLPSRFKYLSPVFGKVIELKRGRRKGEGREGEGEEGKIRREGREKGEKEGRRVTGEERKGSRGKGKWKGGGRGKGTEERRKRKGRAGRKEERKRG